MTGELPGPSPEERPKPSGERNPQGVRKGSKNETDPQPRRAVLSVVVRHEPRVLTRVTNVFSQRNLNIENLTVGSQTNPEYARITLAFREPEPTVEQVKKQLRKLLPVVSVDEFDSGLERELALVKVDTANAETAESVADLYDATLVDVGDSSVTYEVTGSPDEIDSAVSTFEEAGLLDVTRTGTTVIATDRREWSDN